jgi:hypothetical protein
MQKLSNSELEMLNIFITMHLAGSPLTIKDTGIPASDTMRTTLYHLVNKGYLVKESLNYKLTFTR